MNEGGEVVGLRMHLIVGAETMLLAHTARKGTGELPETLLDHSNLVLDFAWKLSAANGLSASLERVVGRLQVNDVLLEPVAQDLIKNWFMQAIYLHDLGKVNPEFQKKRMHNSRIEKKLKLSGDSHHALLSALLYLHIYLPEIEQTQFSIDFKRNRSVSKFMKHVLYVFAYIISRHHTYLTNNEELDGELTQFEKKLKNLQKQLVHYPDYLHYYKHKDSLLSQSADSETYPPIYAQVSSSMGKRLTDKHPPFPFYVLTKLLFSTMVACDFYATHAFDRGSEPPFRYFGQDNPLQPVLDHFRQTANYRAVQAYRNDPESTAIEPINRLRAALFLETEEQLRLHKNQCIYNLEAPTGSGKTFMSLNLALQLLDSDLGLNKLVYVFPFNTLIEQTKQTLDHIFPPDLQKRYRMAVVNSVTPIVTEREMEADRALTNERGEQEPDIPFDYAAELLQRQMLQYPVTLTSHVNFFNYLFGIGRESNLAFTHLCNSVIILDEIQSYRNEIWKEIIYFLRAFAEILNIRLIIMSATLPQLDLLMEDETAQICPLVPRRELYFCHPLFRERVQPHFKLLQHQVMDEDTLLAEVRAVLEERKSQGKSTRLLVEFITKRAARDFYNRLRSLELGIPLFELTGDDSNRMRKEVLSRLGKDVKGCFILPNMLVVATQVIEAGVDIDMDIGFKDISILDSEEQFLGRINRSCLRTDCHAYFFNMIEASKVYRKDWRTEHDLRSNEYQQMLLDKNFSGFYRLCMRRLNEHRSKGNADNWSNLTASIQKLDYPEVEMRMRLILDQTYTLFIEHEITYMTDEGNYEVLNGEQVWKEFEALRFDKELSHAERKVKLSQTQEKMAYFTYSYGIQRQGRYGEPTIRTHRVGNLFYVPNGERFMVMDEFTGAKKFDLDAYLEAERSLLL